MDSPVNTFTILGYLCFCRTVARTQGPARALDSPRQRHFTISARTSESIYLLATLSCVCLCLHVFFVAGKGAGGLLWVVVPWIDSGRNPKITTVVRYCGIAIVIFMAIMTGLGYVLE